MGGRGVAHCQPPKKKDGSSKFFRSRTRQRHHFHLPIFTTVKVNESFSLVFFFKLSISPILIISTQSLTLSHPWPISRYKFQIFCWFVFGLLFGIHSSLCPDYVNEWQAGSHIVRPFYCSGVIETNWWITQCKHQNIQMNEKKNDQKRNYFETSTSVTLDLVELGEPAQRNTKNMNWDLKKSNRKK